MEVSPRKRRLFSALLPAVLSLATFSTVSAESISSALETGRPAGNHEPGSKAGASKTGGERLDAENEAESGEKGPSGTFEIPGTDAKIKIGGYVKLDLIHDFDAIGYEDRFDTSTIATDGSDRENTRAHAKQSRLNLELLRPTRRGDLQIFAEGDFFGSGDSVRLRHAYGSLGPLLAGQTWSTFTDEDVKPPTLDFESPRSYISLRQALIRWTRPLSDRTYVALALEEPDAEFLLPAGVSGTSEDPYPDLTGRLRWRLDAGHLQLSTFVGVARFRPDNGKEADETIWGVNVSGSAQLVGRDRFRFQLAYGDGLARYRGGPAAVVDSSGRPEAVATTALMISYQHFWNDHLHSHVMYSYGENDTIGSVEAAHAFDYAALNLVWEFAEGTSAGVEWLYGTREDNDGSSGEANRLQVAVKFELF